MKTILNHRNRFIWCWRSIKTDFIDVCPASSKAQHKEIERLVYISIKIICFNYPNEHQTFKRRKKKHFFWSHFEKEKYFDYEQLCNNDFTCTKTSRIIIKFETEYFFFPLFIIGHQMKIESTFWLKVRVICVCSCSFSGSTLPLSRDR